MKLPTFFLPGAMKSGTSSLTTLLKQHRNIYCTPEKELPFFSLNYEQGEEEYVRKYFSGWSGEDEVFEANPNLLFLPHVPHRIHETIPNPKFVVILRNPIDRAYSHWWMKYTSGKESLSFRNAIRKNLDRLRKGRTFTYPDSIQMWNEHWAERRHGNPIGKYRFYVDMGHYDRQLERYLDLFPASAMHVTFLSHLVEQPEDTVREIWDFLGVDEQHPFEQKQRRVGAVGTGARSLWRSLCRVGRTLDLNRYLGGDVPERVRRVVQSLFGTEKPEMDEDVRLMLQDHYRPHLERLTDLIDRDVSSAMHMEA